MSIQEAEAQIRKIDEEIRQLEQKDTPDVDFETIKDELEKARHKIMSKAYANLSSYDKVYLARKPTRPNVRDYIENLFDNFLNSVVTVFIVMTILLSAVLPCSTICLLL